MCNQHVLPQRKNISKFNFRCWKLVVFYFVSFNSIIYVRTYWIGLSLYWFPIFTPDWYRYRIHMKAGLLWPKRTKKFSPNFVQIYENPFFNEGNIFCFRFLNLAVMCIENFWYLVFSVLPQSRSWPICVIDDNIIRRTSDLRFSFHRWTIEKRRSDIQNTLYIKQI